LEDVEMNTVVHFVRHAGLLNPDGTVPGRMPGFHLSEEGKKQAKKVGEHLKTRPIKLIFTGPLERAYETANIISKSLPKATITHVFDLNEVDASPWQAYKLEELFTNNAYESYLNEPDTNLVPENINSLAERMKKFAEKLCKEHAGEEIICVSHTDPIVALRLSLEKKAPQLLKTFHVSTGSITTFTFENCNLTETQYTEIQ
jgi:broad specificity phosphatase PhoE